MKADSKDSPLWVYPDPVTGPNVLSGAVFLYFPGPLLFTLPPQVLTPGSYNLLPLIKERQPDWSWIFLRLFRAWRQQQDGSRKMLEALEPLRGKAFKVMWLVYAATSEALEESATLVASSGMSMEEVAELISRDNASGEIIRHIMLERFLELDEDVDTLFDYCGKLFARERLEELLTKGYLLRLPMWRDLTVSDTTVMLTNERLSKFLSALPVEPTAPSNPELDNDVIAWELFRQILSPRLDPLNAGRAEFIAKLLESRKGEIERLKVKCCALAEEIKQPATLAELPDKVELFIKKRVEGEVADLLQLDRRSAEDFFVSLFVDKTTWAATLALIYSLIAGQIHITSGAAIAALSSVGAKGFKAATDRHRKLKQNDYALVYTVTRKS